MRKITIELDEMACKWLDYISELTGSPAEDVLVNGFYRQIIDIEARVFETFSNEALEAEDLGEQRPL